ncbi:unnamed protein product [Miscanthus lutarioriparius]|uniref:Uncharacterized protein n=1 Tax=Miscanthus lutarioriparius TaxID=422564 RepID=A0A811M7D7_9POAL|nr:unnamed protein product [Miscanthus lutarioriparius]
MAPAATRLGVMASEATWPGALTVFADPSAYILAVKPSQLSVSGVIGHAVTISYIPKPHHSVLDFAYTELATAATEKLFQSASTGFYIDVAPSNTADYVPTKCSMYCRSGFTSMLTTALSSSTPTWVSAAVINSFDKRPWPPPSQAQVHVWKPPWSPPAHQYFRTVHAETVESWKHKTVITEWSPHVLIQEQMQQKCGGTFGLAWHKDRLMVPKWLADIVVTFLLLYVREESRYLVTFFATHLIDVQMLDCVTCVPPDENELEVWIIQLQQPWPLLAVLPLWPTTCPSFGCRTMMQLLDVSLAQASNSDGLGGMFGTVVVGLLQRSSRSLVSCRLEVSFAVCMIGLFWQSSVSFICSQFALVASLKSVGWQVFDRGRCWSLASTQGWIDTKLLWLELRVEQHMCIGHGRSYKFSSICSVLIDASLIGSSTDVQTEAHVDDNSLDISLVYHTETLEICWWMSEPRSDVMLVQEHDTRACKSSQPVPSWIFLWQSHIDHCNVVLIYIIDNIETVNMQLPQISNNSFVLLMLVGAVLGQMLLLHGSAKQPEQIQFWVPSVQIYRIHKVVFFKLST